MACNKQEESNNEVTKSVYEIYKERHPEYTGDEATWLDDLMNNRLGTEKTYSLTFDANGGTAVDPITYPYGQRIGTVPVPEKYGYEFTGWKLFGHDLIPEYPMTENLTLVASWKAVEYQIIYDLGGGTNAAENPTFYTIESETIPLADPTYGKGEFVGWTWNGEPFTGLPEGYTGEITLRANWNFLTYALLDDGTYYVTGFLEERSEVIVPSTYHGIPVTLIGNNAFSYNDTIERVVLSDSVKNIGDRSFIFCSNLKSLELGTGLETIQYYAFAGCYRLVEIINRGTYDLYGQEASDSYVRWSAIAIKTEGETGIFKEGEYSFFTHDGTYWLISYDGSDAEITLPSLPEKTYIVRTNTFGKCNFLTKVVIPDCVTKVESAAFEQCANLTTVILPDGLKEVSEIFSECTNLKTVVIGAACTRLYSFLFRDCYRSIKSIFYRGSEENWAKIASNTNTYSAEVYYYSEEPQTGGNYWHFDENGDPAVW